MANLKVTGQEVRDFWKYMEKKYDFKVVQKKDAEEMQLIGWALETMGIRDKKGFLNSCATTICLGDVRRVYMPYEIGVGRHSHLLHQIELCAHEAQHVVQADRERGQPMKYLLSDANRAFYEADAYRATMEMEYFMTGKMTSPRDLANILRGYSIGKADRRIAEKHLRIAAEVVKRGGVITGTSKTAIRWWKNKKKRVPLRKVSYFRV